MKKYLPLNLKLKINSIVFILLFFATHYNTFANTSQSNITAINFGEYASFGGSLWQKARFYDHDEFQADEQGYFIRIYDHDYLSKYVPNTKHPNDYATSTLATSTLPKFYKKMSNEYHIKDAILDTRWSTGASKFVGYTAPGPLTSTSYYSDKIAIPSIWEVAGNQEIFQTKTKSYFWCRTPNAMRINRAWFVLSSSSFNNYGSYDQKFRVRPSLRLSPDVFILSGIGTHDQPYILSYYATASTEQVETKENNNIIIIIVVFILLPTIIFLSRKINTRCKKKIVNSKIKASKKN